MKKKFAALISAFVMVGLLATGCGEDKAKTAKLDLNALSVEDLTKKAKEEGQVNSVGMPDTWANWKDTWQDLSKEYGLKHADVDMSSAEEIAIFEAEKGNATKDIGDVGQSFGPVAESKGVTNKYKTSYWDEIPAWAKDDDGDWIVAYYGTLAVMTNSKLVKTPPKSFDDILKGDYMVTVGDVAKGTQNQSAVLAAAMAYGGGEDNIKPGLDYFKKIAEQGRLDKGESSLARIEKGEIACIFLWDYNAMNYRDQITKNNKDAKFEIAIPKEASIQSGYATILNKYSKNPHAAALAREYILSDKGQINLAVGYATPIRKNVKLPDKVKKMRIPDEQYKNARPISDNSVWEKTVADIGVKWQEEVMAYAK